PAVGFIADPSGLGAECFTNSDCNDGQYCNGQETCNQGHCIAGTTPCSSGFTCDEVNDACNAPTPPATTSTPPGGGGGGSGGSPTTSIGSTTIPVTTTILTSTTTIPTTSTSVPNPPPPNGTTTVPKTTTTAGLTTTINTTSTTTMPGFCPAQKALQNDGASLQILYHLRGAVLSKNSAGKNLIAAYYQHASEITDLFISQPHLRERSHELILKVLPAIGDMIAGRKGTLKESTVQDGVTFIDALSAHASPVLKQSLMALKRDIQGGSLFKTFGVEVQEN
ncbi:MAG: hypothetical protein NTZ51_07185, partial [Proteobacteria bacterium]|nr:hypothetical protein [Pseudomonadota bacterium]